MAEFLTTRGTTHHLEQIIQNAERHLTLITPYLQFSTHVLSRLKLAEAQGIEIDLVCRTDELKTDQRDKLIGLRRLSLYSLENLHAKCYANEHNVLVSSMNLYQHSENNNWR
jgi:hypothetical protein